MSLLELPKEPVDRIQFFNTIFEARRCLDFRIDDVAYHLRFDGNFAVDRPSLSFQITGSESGRLWVSLSDTSRIPGLKAWLGEAQLEQIPTEIAAIVLDGFLASTLEQLGSNIGEVVEIANVGFHEQVEGMDFSLSFVLSDQFGQQTAGVLAFEKDWAPTIKSLVSVAPAEVSTTADGVRVDVPIEIGQTDLSIAELRKLEPLDVVIAEKSEFLSDQRVMLRFPDAMQICCEVEDSQLVVHEISPAVSNSQEPMSATAAGDLQLPLSIQGGRVQLTLEQLKQLESGDELAAEHPTPQTVDMMAGTQLLGKGELVCCGDRLGVRLQSFAPNDSLHFLEKTGNDETTVNSA